MALGAPWSAAAALTAPPGLEDSMTPAKIEISDSLGWSARDMTGGGALPKYMPACSTQGEWVNAVMATAPHLDTPGLQKALQILDIAIGNVQRVKAIEGVIAGAPHQDPMNIQAAELMRAQICEQQQALLHQLHNLRPKAVSGGGAGVGGVPTQSPTYLLAEAGAEGAAMAERVLGALGHPVHPVAGADHSCEGGSHGQVHFAKAEAPKPAGERAGAAVAVTAAARRGQTLSSSLQLLANEDPDCLFIVRRINKLGFKACRKLKQHFSAYGAVTRVLVAHSTVRQHGDPQCHTRRRPSSLGFVQMANAAAVAQVLAQGAEQEVDGSFIRVQRFERQSTEAFEEEDESGAPAVLPAVEIAEKDWQRQHSCWSTVSTHMGFEEEALQDFERQHSTFSAVSTSSAGSQADAVETASADQE